VINSNLGFILHRLATLHPLRTDDNSSTFLLKYGQLKSMQLT